MKKIVVVALLLFIGGFAYVLGNWHGQHVNPPQPKIVPTSTTLAHFRIKWWITTKVEPFVKELNRRNDDADRTIASFDTQPIVLEFWAQAGDSVHIGPIDSQRSFIIRFTNLQFQAGRIAADELMITPNFKFHGFSVFGGNDQFSGDVNDGGRSFTVGRVYEIVTREYGSSSQRRGASASNQLKSSIELVETRDSSDFQNSKSASPLPLDADCVKKVEDIVSKIEQPTTGPN